MNIISPKTILIVYSSHILQSRHYKHALLPNNPAAVLAWRLLTEDTEHKPRGSIYTTMMESHYGIRSQKTIPLWLLGPNSIIVVYVDPLGKNSSVFEVHPREDRWPTVVLFGSKTIPLVVSIVVPFLV